MHTSTHCTLRPLAPKGNGTQHSDLCQSTASCALHHKSSCKCECVCSLFEMNHSVLSNPLPVQRPMNNGSWASRRWEVREVGGNPFHGPNLNGTHNEREDAQIPYN